MALHHLMVCTSAVAAAPPSVRDTMKQLEALDLAKQLVAWIIDDWKEGTDLLLWRSLQLPAGKLGDSLEHWTDRTLCRASSNLSSPPLKQVKTYQLRSTGLF